MPLLVDLPPNTHAAPTARTKPQLPKSVLLDLALNEYDDACAAGTAPPISDFCAKFPAYRTSLRRLLSVRHDLEHLGWLGPTAPADWPAVGATFGKFVLEQELGRGAFARVFLAREPQMGDRRVVVKLSTLAAPEAAILGPLQHRNIMPVLSLEHKPDDKLSALCMPYLGAATLLDVLDHAFADDNHPPANARVILEAAQHALPKSVAEETTPDPVLEQGSYLEGVLHLGIQLADALAAAHAKGVLHCDLKPSNVLLAPDGRPFLLDFNLSRTSTSQGLQAGGTVPYMAPEQLALLQVATGGTVASPPQPATAQADIYSLGVLLCDLLTGLPTFRALDAKTTVADLLRERRNPARKVQAMLPGVRSQTRKTVLRCLAFAPEQRWESAAELASALRACLVPPLHRRWRKAVLTAASLTALVLGGIWLGGGDHWLDSPERAYQRGAGLYRENRYREALTDITKAVDGDQSVAKYRQARGMVRLALHDYATAATDFEDAYARAPGWKNLALCAYANSLGSHDRIAIDFYQRALAMSNGSPTPQLFNNLGYALMRISRFEAALEAFNQAVQCDPNLAEAWYNRAMLEQKLSTFAERKRAPDFHRAVQDMERALQLKYCGKMHYEAAGLYLHLTGENPQQVEQVYRHLRRAVELGFDTKQIKNNPRFSSLAKTPEFQQLLLLHPASEKRDEPISPIVFPLNPEDRILD